jgi:hypothetical protein
MDAADTALAQTDTVATFYRGRTVQASVRASCSAAEPIVPPI